jgi:hypothetical protein
MTFEQTIKLTSVGATGVLEISVTRSRSGCDQFMNGL